MDWTQVYNPAAAWFADAGVSFVVSTFLAALPTVVLLGLLGWRGWPAPRAAGAGLATALAVAVLAYRMPPAMALAAGAYGAAFGLFPIGWIVLGAVFLYTMTVETGDFDKVKASVIGLSQDRRVQALLIAFSFGAFLEGCAGFGAPVAITAALLIGAGFRPLHAAGLALIANTAPVAFGSLGTPIVMLAKVTELPQMQLSIMAGRQLPLFSLIVPAWMIWTMSGWRGVRGVWPALLVSGGSFAAVQFAVSNYLGPSLVDVASGLASLIATVLLLQFWRPAEIWRFDGESETQAAAVDQVQYTFGEMASAWVPWIFLSACIVVWGIPSVATFLDGGEKGSPNLLTGRSVLSMEVPVLHNHVWRDAPAVPRREKPEEAKFKFNWLSATGTSLLAASLLSAMWLGVGPVRFVRLYLITLYRIRWPLATIAMMLAIAYTTRFGGTDVTLGLAFTRTGMLYPFFAPLLGWLGVAVTGSDTSANALFGSLQRITAQQLGLNPILIATSNSTGGVMGKMIAAQSIVVSAAATNQTGNEGTILRYVFWHSVALACLMGLLTLLQAYVLTGMVPAVSSPLQ
jgi:lactate permease